MNFCCNHFNYLISEIFTHFPNNVDGELIYCRCVVGILRLVAIESGRARKISFFRKFLELWYTDKALEMLNLIKSCDLKPNFVKFWKICEFFGSKIIKIHLWAMHADLHNPFFTSPTDSPLVSNFCRENLRLWMIFMLKNCQN